MGISALRIIHWLGITLLTLVLIAGFPGTGKAVKPLKPPLYEPKGFRELEASVAGLRFFATPTSQAVPMKDRAYNTSFLNTDTRYVWWEMCLNTKVKVDHPVTLITWVTWQRADGTEHYQSLVFTIPPNLQSPCVAGSWQDNRPGGWLPGTYLVSIQIDDIEVTSGSFEVLQKFMKEDLKPGKKESPQ